MTVGVLIVINCPVFSYQSTSDENKQFLGVGSGGDLPRTLSPSRELSTFRERERERERESERERERVRERERESSVSD